MMKFKTDKLREEFIKLDPRIKRITEALDAILYAKYGIHAIITSVYREDQKSPHHYYRAVDVRSRDLKATACVFLEAIINVMFPYDNGFYKTVIHHNAGSGYHFHIQVKG